MMKRTLTSLAVGTISISAANAQPAPAPTPDNHDKMAWELFVSATRPVTTSSGNRITFETWASNEDTFQQNPQFPGATAAPNCAPPQVATRELAPTAVAPRAAVASPKILHVPALLALQAEPAEGVEPTLRAMPPASAPAQPTEEVRRNQATFDFIVCNKLFTKAGLRAAFAAGTPLAVPTDSIEIKANWIPAGDRSDSVYYISTTADGQRHALTAMHVISKRVPNWTWATFEHQDNAGRCDVIGCHDSFGAVTADVAPNANADGRYERCAKSPALKQLFAEAGMPALWESYCLKGSQADYVSASGKPTRLGNSVTENGFVETSSCLTCHVRASVNNAGKSLYGGGFIRSSDPGLCPGGPRKPCSPTGAPNPAWFWTNPDQANRTLLALQTDFIWSIALKAVGP
jgi:hypothetical protein